MDPRDEEIQDTGDNSWTEGFSSSAGTSRFITTVVDLSGMMGDTVDPTAEMQQTSDLEPIPETDWIIERPVVEQPMAEPPTEEAGNFEFDESASSLPRERESPNVTPDENQVRIPIEGENAEEQAIKDLLLLKAINAKYLPAFANEENVILNDTVLELELALKKAEEAVEEQDDRASIMEEHMKRVQQEIYFSQSRHEAKQREIATEQHLWKISEFESSRLKGEMKKMSKEKDDIDERLRAFRTALFRANEKMDQFRLLMHWNQEELEQWAQAARQKDEDNTAMDKYLKSDDERIRHLQLEEMKASEEVYRLRLALDTEVTETQSYQIQLDKTAILFRELHSQRQKKDLERMIIDAEGEVVKVRQVAMKEADSMNAIIEVHELQKINHLRAQGELATAIAMKTQAVEEVESKKRKVAAARKRLANAKEKVKEEHDILDSLEKRTEDLSRLLDREEQNYKIAKKAVTDLRDKHYKAVEELHSLKTQEKDTLFEINGGKSQIKALSCTLNTLEMSMRRQDEVLYTLEFQIQALERKVGRAMGERTDLETKETEKKIADLEKQLAEKKAEEALVLSQLKRTQDELRASTRKNEDIQGKVKDIFGKNEELSLECDTGLMTVKLQSKYKTLIARVKLEDGTVRSANYYVIKAAQERQLLELEVPKLEDQVVKVRGDVRKLERANAEIKESNNALRTSLQSEKSIELAQERRVLKEAFNQARHQARLKQREEAALLADLQEAEQRLENAERECATVKETINDLHRKVDAAKQEADEQAVKNRRATNQLQRLAREVKDKLEREDVKKIEKELQLVEVRETVKDVLYKLKGLAMENIEASQVIQEKLNDVGMKFPSTISSARSSRSSSTASSVSSRSAKSVGSARRPLAGSILNMDLGLDDL